LVLSATLLFVNNYFAIAGVVLLIALAPAWSLWRLLKRIERQDRMF